MKKWNLNALLPQCRSSASPLSFRQAGFTVVELMMALILLAIAAALAIPSYRDMVEKRQLTHGAEQILAFVNTIQSEAARANRIMTVSYARVADDDWCVGAVVGASACDCAETVDTEPDYCAIDSVPRIINNTNVGNTELVKAMTGDGAYSIDPIRGIFVDATDSLLVGMSSDSGKYALNLSVSNAGQAILCLPDEYHSVPGYKVCP